MNIENNKYLFLANAGLTALGRNDYDHADVEVSNLVKMIHAAGFPNDALTWFALARTGQVSVNPYWPRGSCLSSACFFVDHAFRFDRDSFFAFLGSTGVLSDPIGIEDFNDWISKLPVFLRLMDEHLATPALWNEYCRIVNSRSCEWNAMIEKAAYAVRAFFNDDAPEMLFSPNLFTPYNADFVRIGNRIVTISSVPDIETMLHETMHTAIAKYRLEIMRYAKTYGLSAFANKEKMLEFGYMEDESVASIAHVIEECLVRALSVVLSGGSEERLRFHAQYGCDSVPFIASCVRVINPT
jgi:hypothetical protein